MKCAATTTNDLFGAPADGILPVKKTERKMYIDVLYILVRFFNTVEALLSDHLGNWKRWS